MTGQVTLLTSNGGPHPADRWAALAAAQVSSLIVIDEDSVTADAATARKAQPVFQIAFANAVEPIFDQVAAAETANVAANPSIKRSDPYSITSFLPGVITAVTGAAANTPFTSHFQDATVQAYIQKMFTQYFLDAANISRSWALDAKGL
ncbi:hypothetical protein [Bradyrhizobium sp. dw_78]|uniref:hypothetical protein n=1 Tax=Bradyrhizobium sp. dw_78 TaxID=2719793 RepID=UPI001BD6B960|nr:hypothetical protein [Bradyrhizobium sp. dw_78]